MHIVAVVGGGGDVVAVAFVAGELESDVPLMVPPESGIKKGGYQPSEESGFDRGYRPQGTVITPIPPQGGTGTVAKPASSDSDAKKP